MSDRHPHSNLIDEVGAKVVTERYNLSAQALCNWRARGIPLIRRVSFAKLAAEHGVVPPADFLAELAA